MKVASFSISTFTAAAMMFALSPADHAVAAQAKSYDAGDFKGKIAGTNTTAIMASR